MSFYAAEGGEGADLLVLLHGLGATGAVWMPFLESIGSRWQGRWFAPDLPGHGKSPRAPRYSIELDAAVVGEQLQNRIQPGGRVVILGHSFGGGIGLACASGRYGFQPDLVCSVGIKLLWTDQDVARMQSLAAQPAKIFATEEEAWNRYLKVSGLAGLVPPGSPVAARGITRDEQGWRLAMDPEANNAGKPALADMMAAARCPAHLARGGQDQIVTLEQMRALDPSTTDLGSYGHNVMVEAPEVVWEWFLGRLQHR